ncbi:hypothetical protein [Trueperella pecoris]|uniref:Uncharacterized protein n=1 Tax=Trueperella pecoris TaxID=2733571 RepID=A0A7M1QTA2_9ACTO|nr:hypothetical protein [Trueperella pecoris]QOQ38214.1 hypothetical protein HLG82_01305 [Trueperella pecoris]QOR45300.1 hypothetical protein INS88_08505 [Trueperella pecoris]
MDEIARWRTATEEVSALLIQYSSLNKDNPWIKNYPSGSCSVSSYTIGRLLLERHGEDWQLRSGTGHLGSHTWLTLDSATLNPAAIDATLHQFSNISKEPFIGYGVSPAENHFQPYQSMPVKYVEPSWHHGGTAEIYAWVFPRLGLDPPNTHDGQGS